MAESLKGLDDWDLESVYDIRKSSIEMDESFPLFGSGNLDDPERYWDLDIALNRMAIENVASQSLTIEFRMH